MDYHKSRDDIAIGTVTVSTTALSSSSGQYNVDIQGAPYAMYEVMAARGGPGLADLIASVCKFLADFFYLLPMVTLWTDFMPKQRHLATYLKGVFVIVFAILTWASNVHLVNWAYSHLKA
ncbi:hypothetical protein R1flu_012854 [Riccia fluitans]|uniref:Uncharacterized protein n=1 Tax=Riccia fluitans TaxID=41844 RepID=A0ABD1ZBS5_9MARC